MNKVQLAEWLLKRVGNKMSELRYPDSSEVAELLADDIDDYLSILKDIIVETVKP